MQWVHQQSRTMSAVGLLRRLACGHQAIHICGVGMRMPCLLSGEAG